MSHLCITLAFAGTNYHGFQVQKNALTVCEVLQNALEKLYGVRPDMKGCSRTDAGVHALAYEVSYHAPREISLYKLPLAINYRLPPDVRVLRARAVPPDFHARYSSVSKEYIYRIHNSAIDNLFQRDYAWRCPVPLDVEKMQRAATLLCGRHDYTSFMSAGSDIEDAVREVYFFKVTRQGEDITLHISANGYLYNMVRILVGTLVEIGAGRRQPDDVVAVLRGKNRALAGDTAPAKGLFLYQVHYE